MNAEMIIEPISISNKTIFPEKKIKILSQIKKNPDLRSWWIRPGQRMWVKEKRSVSAHCPFSNEDSSITAKEDSGENLAITCSLETPNM